MRDPLKSLEAIHTPVGGDFGMDMDMLVYQHPEGTDPRLLEAAKLISQIYKIVHSEVATCTHRDWEEIKDEILMKEV